MKIIKLNEFCISAVNDFSASLRLIANLLNKGSLEFDDSLPLSELFVKIAKKDRDILGFIRDAAFHLPSLFAIHAELAKLLVQTYPEFGKGLITGDLPFVRIDLPNETKHLDIYHQEASYYDAPSDSFTLWLPFQEMNDQMGPVEFIEASETAQHLPVLYSMERPYVSIIDFKGWDKCNVASPLVKLGEAVLFNHRVIHRSQPNNSDYARCSLQFRFNLISNDKYRDLNYPKTYGNKSIHIERLEGSHVNRF